MLEKEVSLLQCRYSTIKMGSLPSTSTFYIVNFFPIRSIQKLATKLSLNWLFSILMKFLMSHLSVISTAIILFSCRKHKEIQNAHVLRNTLHRERSEIGKENSVPYCTLLVFSYEVGVQSRLAYYLPGLVYMLFFLREMWVKLDELR